MEKIGEQTFCEVLLRPVDVIHLEGILFQVEELNLGHIGKQEKLVIIPDNATLTFQIAAVDRIVTTGLPFPDRLERLKLHMLRFLNRSDLQRSRHDILQIHGFLIRSTRLHSGADYHQRHFHTVLKQTLFSNQTVMPHGQAMVCGEKDVGILLLPACLQLVQNATDLLVHVGNDRVVFLAVHFNGIFRPRKQGELLIP